ncbi:unnamed protein product [Musa acuminata subsp. burmannicoides]
MLGKTLPVFYAEYERTHNIISNLHRFEAETPLTAMSQVAKEIFMENTDFFPIKPVDYGRFLVISLGTGSNKQEGRFTAQESSKRGVLSGCTTRAPPPSSTSSRNGRPRLCSLSSAVIGEAVLRIQVRVLASRRKTTTQFNLTKRTGVEVHAG